MSLERIAADIGQTDVGQTVGDREGEVGLRSKALLRRNLDRDTLVEERLAPRTAGSNRGSYRGIGARTDVLEVDRRIAVVVNIGNTDFVGAADRSGRGEADESEDGEELHCGADYDLSLRIARL